MRSALRTCCKLALYGTLCVTIPDAKDAKVIAARDLFNARQGASLNTTQYVKHIVQTAVVGELLSARVAGLQATAQAGQDAAAHANATAAAGVDTNLATENAGW